MVIPYSKIVGLNVIELSTQTNLGKVFDLTIQKSDLKISAVVLEKDFWTRSHRVVSAGEIIELAKEAIIVNNTDSVHDIKDNLRIKEAYKEHYRGTGQKVVTKSGKRIGKVYDFLVCSETLEITRLYVKNLFSERIIAATAVISYDKHKFVIKDDYEMIKISAQAVRSSCIA